MTDLLVKLYQLPDDQAYIKQLENQGIRIRRALVFEKHKVIPWITTHFNEQWADECEAGFYRQPVSCLIAVEHGSQGTEANLAGFACYDCTMRNFFGPIGVAPGFRGMNVGKLLLLTGLKVMSQLGYAYAIVGGSGKNAAFFEKHAGAVRIEGSEPGIYPTPKLR